MLNRLTNAPDLQIHIQWHLHLNISCLIIHLQCQINLNVFNQIQIQQTNQLKQNILSSILNINHLKTNKYNVPFSSIKHISKTTNNKYIVILIDDETPKDNRVGRGRKYKFNSARSDSLNSMIDFLLKHKIKSEKQWCDNLKDNTKNTNKLKQSQYDLLNCLDNILHKLSNNDVFGTCIIFKSSKQ